MCRTRTVNIRFEETLMIMSFPDAPGTEVEIVSVNGDAFRSVKGNAEISFSRNEQGAVVGFTARQGETFEWEKID